MRDSPLNEVLARVRARLRAIWKRENADYRRAGRKPSPARRNRSQSPPWMCMKPPCSHRPPPRFVASPEVAPDYWSRWGVSRFKPWEAMGKLVAAGMVNPHLLLRAYRVERDLCGRR